MPSIGSETRTIRFNAADLGLIEATMKKEDVSFNGAVHLLINGTGTPQNQSKTASGTPEKEEKPVKTGTPYEVNKVIPKSDYESIAEMANLMRVTTEKLLADMKDILENGELYYSGGKLRNPKYEEFENVCEARKQKVENILMRVIRDM